MRPTTLPFFSLSLLCSILTLAGIACEETLNVNRDEDPCLVITCSQHGVCVTIGGAPTCACDEGYQADPTNGLACLATSSINEINSSDMNDTASYEEQPDMMVIRRDQEPADEGLTDLTDEGSVNELDMMDLSAGDEIDVEAGSEAGAEAGEPSGGDSDLPLDISCSEAPASTCIDEVESEGMLNLCDGFDNDCDGAIDEGCFCKAGEVKSCFSGPLNRLNFGACSAGTMRCLADGPSGSWGPCEGEVAPSSERCDGLDNDCNGCLDEIPLCNPEGSCPGPNDPRTPDAQPFAPYRLNGADFYSGEAAQWSWTVTGGPCDTIIPNRSSFTLTGQDNAIATFVPTLSGSYRVTLVVISAEGERFECSWVIHVRGPGLRVEMCYPESQYLDLDLFLMRHSAQAPWFLSFDDPFTPSPLACSWANCEAQIRGFGYSRADWGYATSPINQCIHTPQGVQWSQLVGHCANPRLDIDNNLSEGIGVPENINIDQPVNGESYRVMVHNFSGALARPIVNIYCGGERRATIGEAPDEVPNFQGASVFAIGAMWRAVDVTTIVDEEGVTTDCLIEPIHPPGQDQGYDVTQNDPRF